MGGHGTPGREGEFLRGAGQRTDPVLLELDQLDSDELFVLVALDRLERDADGLVAYERVVQYAGREYGLERRRAEQSVESLLAKDYLSRTGGDRLALSRRRS